ncbi:hypothetical protein DPQ25_11910 [Hydrogeniiclostridium mannosilyticum]|uniref:Uncharacterized protein n=1 Tax=Hydrogeniiclostridium mannosilyticum TaxID=2764322 RepID=A0A328UBJ2_9FIRM|nr:hypothetical protein DPQ25_11910 [Hydrogeniiclostridium mannosilyticum]
MICSYGGAGFVQQNLIERWLLPRSGGSPAFYLRVPSRIFYPIDICAQHGKLTEERGFLTCIVGKLLK